MSFFLLLAPGFQIPNYYCVWACVRNAVLEQAENQQYLKQVNCLMGLYNWLGLVKEISR
jgi:hypothetical protein